MSDQETTENFWKVWNSFQWPEPKPISYRCYYDDTGAPIIYTMEDLPGNYIEISKEMYLLSAFNARVVHGQLKVFSPKNLVKKLRPNAAHGTPCYPTDVCVMASIEDCHTLWSKKENEIC